jgi:putative salt-induced outer membrane protein YdiY
MKYLVAILLITSQLFGLVSIKPVEIGENPGVSGGVELGLETKRGNTHKDAYKGSLRVMYDTNASYLTWAEVSGEYGKANDVEDTNKIYAHLRYIHKLTQDVIRYELFAQTQEDKFKALSHRSLAGAGLRFKIFNTPIGGQGYFGLGGFYENIEYVNPTIDPDEENVRANTYIAYSVNFSNKSSLAYTLYYQPNTDKLEDYVMTNQLELILQVYEKLYLKFSATYDADSYPPNGIEEKYDFSQSTTFLYKF